MIKIVMGGGPMFKHDPVEDTPEYISIQFELEELIAEKLKNRPRGLGYCHIYWSVKKHILKEKYNIDWRSPAEMNPGTCFD